MTQQSIWERRNDLKGAKLVNVILPSFPVSFYEEGQPVSQARGYGIDILTLMARKLNFTFVNVEPEDGLWGYKAPNETNFNGIVGTLQR